MISPVNLSAWTYHSPRAESGKSVTPSGTGGFSSSPISVRIPGANCVYSGGDGLGQTAYAEYTDDSTQSDPIVRISGHSLSGDYEKMVHLNEIDPNHASYPELCALLGHQQKIGVYQPKHGMILGVPLDVDRGDYSQPQNFTQKISGSIAYNRRNGNLSMANLGEALLRCYERFIGKKREEEMAVAIY